MNNPNIMYNTIIIYMETLSGNIEKLTLENTLYRKVITTTSNMQLVVMCLLPKQSIGIETHEKTTQFFRVEYGQADVVFGDKNITLNKDDFAIVPPNTPHNVTNKSQTDLLKLYTIYTPPEHPKICEQQTREKYCADIYKENRNAYSKLKSFF